MILALLSLALAAFAAATLLPMNSEIVFTGLWLGDLAPAWAIIVVASLANTAGSIVNWAMGRGVERFRGTKYWPIKDKHMAKVEGWYEKYGLWTLLLSWAPLGDVITVIAGVMRTPLWIFVALVGLSKTLRYCALAIILSFF